MRRNPLFTTIVVSLITLAILSISTVITYKNNDKPLSLNPFSVTKDVYKTEVLGVEEKPSLRLMAVGDIMMGRTIGKNANGSYNTLFSEVKPILNDADILFGNLESPLSDRGSKISGKGITFTAKPKSAGALSYAGFDVVSIANNHILDYNYPSLSQTIEVLDNKKILHCGAGQNLTQARQPAIIDHFGLKVAFLAYTDMYNIRYSKNGITFEAGENKAGAAPRKLDYILEDINNARSKADMVIVSLHWGVEETFTVTDEMREFAHTLIDSGADAILGHHPHQIQGIEIYNGKPIAYSLGNFIFDQNDDENKESIILDLSFDKDKKLVEARAIPLRIYEKLKVIPAPPDKIGIIQNRLIQLSSKLNTNAHIDSDGKAVEYIP